MHETGKTMEMGRPVEPESTASKESSVVLSQRWGRRLSLKRTSRGEEPTSGFGAEQHWAKEVQGSGQQGKFVKGGNKGGRKNLCGEVVVRRKGRFGG